MVGPSDPTQRAIHRMLNPRSIAVVGATERQQYGGRFLKLALRGSDRVRVYPVNPRYEELMGVRCYPSVKDLPESPDLVGIVVPHDRVMDVLKDSAERGANSAVVISAGFAERGVAEREDLQRRVGDFARTSGVRVCGPNCIGLLNLKSNIYATAYTKPALCGAGPIALVSQSGGNAFGPLLSRAEDWGIGYSYVVSTGNEADLESTDFIRYLLDDVDTRVIACYIEGFKDARKFLEVARLAQERGKPIVMIKVGRSSFGTKAAISHTAALTGSDAVHDAVFKQYGVIRVDDYDGLIEVSQMLGLNPAPKNEGVAAVSHSGGITTQLADKFGEAGLSLPDLSEGGLAGLNDILKGFGWAANPADVTGNANSANFAQIMDLLIEEPDVGTLVVASGGGDSQAQQVIDLRAKTDKAMAFLWTASHSATAGLGLLKESDIPVYYQPGRLALSIRALLEYYPQREQFLKDIPAHPPATSPQQRKQVDALCSLGRRALSEHETKGLLSSWGVPVTRELRAATLDEALSAAQEIGYPLVLKVESPDILHKTEAGLVCIGIGGDEDLRQAYDSVMKTVESTFGDARILGVLVQEMVTGGVEAIVGINRDSQFGPVVLFGMGGIFVEILNEVSLRVCPISRRDAVEMVGEVRGAIALEGYRGRPPADVDALVEVLMRVSDLGMNLGDRLVELDINPLAVLPRGQGVKALDAMAVLDN